MDTRFRLIKCESGRGMRQHNRFPSSNLGRSAISLDIQANKKNVHETVHETTPKVSFPGSFFCVSNPSHRKLKIARHDAGRLLIVPLSGLSQQ